MQLETWQSSVSKTLKKHNKHLLNLMKIILENGLIFIFAELDIWQLHISFCGCIFTADVIRPDSAKIQGIVNIWSPQMSNNFKVSWALLTSCTFYAWYVAQYCIAQGLLEEKPTCFSSMSQLVRPSSGSKPSWPQSIRILSGTMIIPRLSLYRQTHPAEAFGTCFLHPLPSHLVPYGWRDPLCEHRGNHWWWCSLAWGFTHTSTV